MKPLASANPRSIFAVLFLAAGAVAGTLDDPPERPAEYWTAIVERGFEVPDGEDPVELLLDLFRNLGSHDPALRDDCGYGITYRWVVRQSVVAPEDCVLLVEDLLARLRTGIGQRGDDSVLQRSFAALNLSLLASYDLESHFLERADFALLLDEALLYLADEQDVRGHHPEWGWVHSVAHTADLLRFLARSEHLGEDEARRMLEAIGQKMVVADRVFVHGEDERMAAALLSLTARDDFRADWLEPLFETMREGYRRRPGDAVFDDERNRARQNSVHLLRAYFVALSQSEEPSAESTRARERVLEFLGRA